MSDGFLKTKQPLRGKGLLMVSNGTQISGFSQKIGSASSLVVELVSFLGFTRVIVELDALLVVSFLNVPVKIHTKSVLLVDDCRSLKYMCIYQNIIITLFSITQKIPKSCFQFP